ncbi:hypothetical protein BD779DRAFT_1468961 [Infundibulicybe gibba]|nr:hypothetical protein BD779DRAFT_1468961 [Infundibulicybe gibba]
MATCPPPAMQIPRKRAAHTNWCGSYVLRVSKSRDAGGSGDVERGSGVDARMKSAWGGVGWRTGRCGRVWIPDRGSGWLFKLLVASTHRFSSLIHPMFVRGKLWGKPRPRLRPQASRNSSLSHRPSEACVTARDGSAFYGPATAGFRL